MRNRPNAGTVWRRGNVPFCSTASSCGLRTHPTRTRRKSNPRPQTCVGGRPTTLALYINFPDYHGERLKQNGARNLRHDVLQASSAPWSKRTAPFQIYPFPPPSPPPAARRLVPRRSCEGPTSRSSPSPGTPLRHGGAAGGSPERGATEPWTHVARFVGRGHAGWHTQTHTHTHTHTWNLRVLD